MKRLLYLTTWDFSNEESDGIAKKIRGQMKAFQESGFAVDYTCILNNETYYVKDGVSHPLGKVGKFRKLAANYYLYKRLKKESYVCIYNRYGLMDTFYLKLLKGFSKKGTRIVVEIPTYPYDKECPPGLTWWMLYSLDKLYRTQVKKYVDLITTYSEDSEIFGIKAIQICNGVDYDKISIRIPQNETDEIRLLAVAGLARWHGYDRLLKGIGEYYQQGGKRKVIMHIVGKGNALAEYEEIVERYGIQEYYVFHGEKRGEELTPIYDMCDIGIECLGLFRKSVTMSSSLKSREYVAKGLPFVMAGQSDVLEGKEFVLKVPDNETPIDVEDIVKFYDQMYNGKSKIAVAESIRKETAGLCDIRMAMSRLSNILRTFMQRKLKMERMNHEIRINWMW